MNDTHPLVPKGIRHDTAALYDLPTEERLKQHGKNLRAIAFTDGIEGIKRYKAEHPEAASFRTELAPLVYLPKPAGYDASLIELAEGWLTDNAPPATNRADVERLNARFGGDRFNPANHFSKPLSPGRLEKLKALFAERGIPLDTEKANTLSKVKAAAVAARGRMSADRPFGNVGVISGDRLVIGAHSLAIMDHHGHEAVKLTVNGKRVWLRLDVMAAAFDLLSGGAETGGNPLQSILYENIGESVPEPEKPDFDPLAEQSTGELVPATDASLGESVPASDPPSLNDRIAALRAAFTQPTATAYPDGVDPLAL